MREMIQAVANWFESGGWVPLLALVIACPMLYGGVTGVWQQARFLAVSERATGQVDEVLTFVERDPDLPSSNKKRRTRWHVRTRFVPQGGQEVTFISEVIGGFGPGVAKGDQPSVAYMPGDPEGTAQILVGTRGLVGPALLFGAGLVVAFGSVAMALKR